jgi:hypothetical protein
MLAVKIVVAETAAEKAQVDVAVKIVVGALAGRGAS